MNRPSSYRLLTIVTLALLLAACQPSQNDKPVDGDDGKQSDAKSDEDSASSNESTVDISKLKRANNTPDLSAPKTGPALPDFASISDVGTKKRAFFAFLQPMIEQENQHLAGLRQHFDKLQVLLNQQGQLHPQDQQWLTKTARLYRADADTTQQQLTLLLAKVDHIPPALVKAQAANESAWGTSRFARQANNLFGQWCFQPGCGIAPLQRGANDTHEVQAFSSVAAGLRSYFTNLNGNRSYASLRQIRRCLNGQNDQPNGRALAAGLTNYSARGGHYVEELQAMIRINKLEPWQADWWGENNPKHACYSLVQVEADHPDPVVVAAVTPASSATSSPIVSASIASTSMTSASTASASITSALIANTSSSSAITTSATSNERLSHDLLSNNPLGNNALSNSPASHNTKEPSPPANAILSNQSSSSAIMSTTEPAALAAIAPTSPAAVKSTAPPIETTSTASAVSAALPSNAEQQDDATDENSPQSHISAAPSASFIEQPAPIVATPLASLPERDIRIDNQPDPLTE
ncbi:MAG: glucosaminidase domain-containing protein [Motiliproteus sp.]